MTYITPTSKGDTEMVLWIGGSAISKTRHWVKEFVKEGEPALRSYIDRIRTQYREDKASGASSYELNELVACGKYAVAAYFKAYGKNC